MSTVNKADMPLGFAAGISTCIIGMLIWWYSNAIHIVVVADLKKNHNIECMKVIHEHR